MFVVIKTNLTRTTFNRTLPEDFWQRHAQVDNKPLNPWEDVYSVDNLIDIHPIWVQDEGRIHRILIEKFHENLRFVAEFADEVLRILRDQGSRPGSAFLRINEWFDFDLLVTVDEPSFVSDGFSKVYATIRELEQRYRIESEADPRNGPEIGSDSLNCTTYLMPVEDGTDNSFNTEALNADGYIFTLVESPEAGTRPS